MRRLLGFIAILTVSPVLVAGEAEDVRDKALRARAADLNDLKKFRSHELKAKGTSSITASPTQATHEVIAVWPAKLRARWEFQVGAGKTTLTICANGDRGWKQTNMTPSVDSTVDEVNDTRSDAYAYWLATLVPFLEGELPVKLGPPGKVGGHSVVNLVVSRRAWPEVTLSFDSTTYQLRKMVYTSRDAGVNLTKEMIYDGQKLVNGVQMPTSQITMVQGKEIYKWTEMTYRVLDKLEPNTFDKP